jgi:hypothetical protein
MGKRGRKTKAEAARAARIFAYSSGEGMTEAEKFVEMMNVRFGATRLPMRDMMIDEWFYGCARGDIVALGVFADGHHRFDVANDAAPGDVTIARFIFSLRSILAAHAIAVTRAGDGLNVNLTFNESMPPRCIVFPSRELGGLIGKAEALAHEKTVSVADRWLREQIGGAVLSALLEDVVALDW